MEHPVWTQKHLKMSLPCFEARRPESDVENGMLSGLFQEDKKKEDLCGPILYCCYTSFGFRNTSRDRLYYYYS